MSFIISIRLSSSCRSGANSFDLPCSVFSEEKGDERCWCSFEVLGSVMAHMRFLIHPTDHAISEDWFFGDAKCLRVCVCARGYILPPCCTCSSVYTCTKRASNFVLQLRRQVLTICKMEGMDGCSSFHGGFLSAWRSQLGRPEYSSSWHREGKDYSLSNTYKRKRANVKNFRI